MTDQETPGSISCRNGYLNRLQAFIKGLGRCSPAKGLARPGIEGQRHCRKVVRAVGAQVSALGEILAQQPIGVLVHAAMPRAVRIAEGDVQARVDLQPCVLGHLRSLIPGQ